MKREIIGENWRFQRERTDVPEGDLWQNSTVGRILTMSPRTSVVAQCIWDTQWWEKEFSVALKTTLPAFNVMWDVGAHIGWFTLLLRTNCKRAVCFEPDAEAVKYLTANICANGLDSIIVPNALMRNSDTYFVSGGICFKGTQGKQALSLERAIESGEKPDFIKMDIEGGEYELIREMRNLNWWPQWFAVELHCTLLSVNAMAELLRILGDVYEVRWHGSHPDGTTDTLIMERA